MARSTLFSLSLFASLAFARTVEYKFTVANGKVAPNGVTRDAVLVNNRFPGPLITANKGDTLKVIVKNKLDNPTMRRSTAIHWHGLFQAGNAEDDGPAFVTQCPIAPKESFTYNMPLHEQTGTYWYHSHLGSQYVDGLRGPLVIYPNDPCRNQYDVDDESTVLTIADWYNTTSTSIIESGSIARQAPDSGTINGKGRSDPNTPATPDNSYVLKVKRGKRYRLRLINAGAIAAYRFSVQGHKLSVIEADGIATKPLEVDSLDILAGQRYSVVLKADQKPDTYWINAPMTNVQNKTTQALLIYEDDKRPYHQPWGNYRKWSVSKDILDYWAHNHGHMGHHGPKGQHKGHKARLLDSGHGLRPAEDVVRARDASHAVEASEFEKRQNTNATEVVLDESKLVPLEKPGAPGGDKPADVVIPLDFDVAGGKWRINGISWVPPNKNTLLKILADKDGVTDSDFNSTEHTVILPKNEVIEFVIKSVGFPVPITHPVHFHGHAFDVVQFGNNTPNYENPPRRDVVGVSPTRPVRIQFRTDNPGPWFLHCHIDWHLEEGFAMVFAEAPEAIKKVVKPTDEWRRLCKSYDALSEDMQ